MKEDKQRLGLNMKPNCVFEMLVPVLWPQKEQLVSFTLYRWFLFYIDITKILHASNLNTPPLFQHSKRNIKKTTSNAYNSMCLLTFNENKTLVLYIPGSFLKYWKSPLYYILRFLIMLTMPFLNPLCFFIENWKLLQTSAS